MVSALDQVRAKVGADEARASGDDDAVRLDAGLGLDEGGGLESGGFLRRSRSRLRRRKKKRASSIEIFSLLGFCFSPRSF
jgi:hypothetical protein